eukprot:10358224-Prorocentrum_lima.AAC.1
MTSSLVGSEMCIRDSYRAFAQEEIEIKANKVRTMLYSTIEFMLTLEAVSYTHLTLPTICSV